MSVQKRLSRVGSLRIDSLLFSTVAQLGDNVFTELNSKAIALARAIPDFEGDETRFAAYPIFFLPLRELRGGPTVRFSSRSPCGEIHVGSVRAVVAGTSCLLRLGTSETFFAESRIKHIRQFNDRIGTSAEFREQQPS
ncbi:spore germination protein GerPE [Cohnella sp. CFH 77786]|uniref:spore germination protein GerPE n=1 Tax=Cohnella sp. CFH 77786 TaxID=2662265 RepID=UPI001C60A674|nr:spore germination protein GerPE [Cohnella sp. CFH 77786]MBW5446812.1 spore germination protein GerPE [Cohnella sp. CFH 77786]